MKYIEFFGELNDLTILTRILIAGILGGLIGIERGRRGRAAGLRTYILVSVGAALATVTGMVMVSKAGIGDPSRIASGVVSGVGFLGAGMIMIRSSRITGLTTAAALWATATIGIAVGAGLYVPAVAGGLIIYITTALLPLLESTQRASTGFYIEINDKTRLNTISDEILARYPDMNSFELLSAKSEIEGHVAASFSIPLSSKDKADALKFLREIESVVFAIER